MAGSPRSRGRDERDSHYLQDGLGRSLDPIALHAQTLQRSHFVALRQVALVPHRPDILKSPNLGAQRDTIMLQATLVQFPPLR